MTEIGQSNARQNSQNVTNLEDPHTDPSELPTVKQ